MKKINLKHFWNNPDERTRKMNRNTVNSMFIRVAGILVSLLLVPFTLGYLNPYEYGIWITLNSILTWINYFDIGLGNGLRNKLGEAIAGNDMKLGRVYVSTTFALLSIIVGILCIGILIANTFIDWNNVLNTNPRIDNLNELVNIVMLCICASFVLRTIGVIYMSYQRTWMSSLLTFLGSLLSLIWIIYLKYFEEPSLVKVALAYSLSPLIIYILFYPITFYQHYKEIRPSLKHIQWRHAKSLGGLGIQFFVLQIAMLIVYGSSNFLISRIFSPEEVTPYSIANRYFNVVVLAFTILINPLWSAITDAYARKDKLWIKRSINKMIKLWGLSSLGIVLMVVISPIVYKIWIGHEVVIPISLSISIAVYNVILLWTNLFSAYCNGVGHLKNALWSMCIAAVLFIPTCLFTTKSLGVDGVAYSMGLVWLIPAVVLYLTYKKDIRGSI